MTRYFLIASLFWIAVGPVRAQPANKYTPLPAKDLDPEALKRLSAMLNGGGDDSSKLDPKQLELLQRFLKDTENNPELRQKMIDAARQQYRENPQQLQKDFKQSSPDASSEELKQLMQNLGKPGDPPPPRLPRPGDRPPPTPSPQPISPKPPGPNPNRPNEPFNPGPSNKQPTPNPQRSGKPGANSEQVQGAVQMWEQSVGPIDSTPAVKDAIVDLFGNGGPGSNQKPFWDTAPDTGSGGSTPSSGFWKFLNGGNGGGSSWTSPSWMKNFNASSPSAPSAPKTGFNAPSAPNIGGLGGVSLAGLGTVGTVIFALIFAAIIGFLIWKFLPLVKELRNRTPKPLPGQGPWPIDPRTIHDREGLVLAFEYLSILVCGNGAVVWNHLTIAEALRDALPHVEHLAEPLARLYAVARYTPLREEIPESAYAEARHCLCQLAGVSEV